MIYRMKALIYLRTFTSSQRFTDSRRRVRFDVDYFVVSATRSTSSWSDALCFSLTPNAAASSMSILISRW